MMRRVGSWLAAGLVVGAVLSGLRADASKPERANDELYKELELFEHSLAIVRSDYVEEPDAQKLIYGAIKGMLSTLDPYSQFMDPDSYNELKVDTEGEFGGLGIEITIKDELLTIISPIDGTPAQQAGLLPGDRIVKIDGELTRGITLLEAVKKLRGRPATRVTLTILREKDNKVLDVPMDRAIIKIESVREAKVLDGTIGYIRLSDFREQTVQDLTAALEQLKLDGMDSLILDLRNNPGGLLDVAVSVSQLFLNRGQLVVTTKGRLRNQNMEFRARTDGLVNGIPLVVLINEGSASASEIVAGAIQDDRHGIIMGTKSHGKASVQTIFPLKDGSALRLTTSKYFTPSGRSIHGEGITPDVPVPFEPLPQDAKPDQAKAIFEQLETGEAAPEGEPPQPEAKRDNQLARAVDLLKGIKAYRAAEQALP
jgi:carboxyl-terminal processing protease